MPSSSSNLIFIHDRFWCHGQSWCFWGEPYKWEVGLQRTNQARLSPRSYEGSSRKLPTQIQVSNKPPSRLDQFSGNGLKPGLPFFQKWTKKDGVFEYLRYHPTFISVTVTCLVVRRSQSDCVATMMAQERPMDHYHPPALLAHSSHKPEVLQMTSRKKSGKRP